MTYQLFVSSSKNFLLIFHQLKCITEVLQQGMNFKCSMTDFVAVEDNKL
jgi:hypothetical protein